MSFDSTIGTVLFQQGLITTGRFWLDRSL